MKNFFALFLTFALAAAACWFEEPVPPEIIPIPGTGGGQPTEAYFTAANFNSVYIAGLNDTAVHYEEAENLTSAVYYNGQPVAMPITVWVKVSPRLADQPGEAEGPKPILRAMLQYKILPSGSWMTVRDYDNPDWDINFDDIVPLFGTECINLNLLPGTEMLIRMYVNDGTYANGDPRADISSYIPDTVTWHNGKFTNGWSAPHVMRVIISGWRPAR